MNDTLYLSYVCALIGGRDLAGFFVDVTRIMVRKNRAYIEKKRE